MSAAAKSQMSQQVKQVEMLNTHRHFSSLEEYFEFEYKSTLRHEYYNGKIVECAYTSENHSLIVHNLNRLLGNCLLDENCFVFSEKMLYIPIIKRVFYPDVMVVCGQRENYQYSKNMTATLNPSVWVEVLSNSTEHIDTVGIKKQSFRYIASLKQYILISQDEKCIEVYTKEETSGNWIVEIFTTDDENITIGQCQILLKEIYRKVDFPTVEAVSES
jgi:Uma2 family endonuclease